MLRRKDERKSLILWHLMAIPSAFICVHLWFGFSLLFFQESSFLKSGCGRRYGRRAGLRESWEESQQSRACGSVLNQKSSFINRQSIWKMAEIG
jgi:hypothetical protein